MTIAAVVTRGYGSFGSIGEVVTRGYLPGAPVVVVPTPISGGGGGGVRYLRHRPVHFDFERIREIIQEALAEIGEHETTPAEVLADTAVKLDALQTDALAQAMVPVLRQLQNVAVPTDEEMHRYYARLLNNKLRAEKRRLEQEEEEEEFMIKLLLS